MLYICLFWRCSIRFDFVLISFEHNASQLSVYLHVSVTLSVSMCVPVCVFTISFSVQHPLAFRSIWAWQVARSNWCVYMAHGEIDMSITKSEMFRLSVWLEKLSTTSSSVEQLSSWTVAAFIYQFLFQVFTWRSISQGRANTQMHSCSLWK